MRFIVEYTIFIGEGGEGFSYRGVNSCKTRTEFQGFLAYASLPVNHLPGLVLGVEGGGEI